MAATDEDDVVVDQTDIGLFSACSGGQHEVMSSVCYIEISDCCLQKEDRYTHVQSCSQLEHGQSAHNEHDPKTRRGWI